MNLSLSIWFIIFVSVIAANLPFVINRTLLLGPRLSKRKAASWHIVELALLYVLVGLMARGLEQYSGRVAQQGWEFYAITACLFLTFATPGFVYRYLLQRKA